MKLQNQNRSVIEIKKVSEKQWEFYEKSQKRVKFSQTWNFLQKLNHDSLSEHWKSYRAIENVLGEFVSSAQIWT